MHPTPASAKPISNLRRRMLEDMAVRRMGEKTQHDYIRHIETFAIFLGRSPDTATAEDLRRFQVHEMEQGAQPPKMNTQVSALRFLFRTTLGRADLVHQLARVEYPRKLPRVLSPEDVARLLDAAPGPGLKYKAALSIAYGAGLTPRRYQSGELDSNRGISKCGDSLMRTYLFEAANTLLTRVEKWSALKAWGLRLAKHSGMKKAKIAVARKLAVMMHCMWLTGEPFRWSQPEQATV